MFYDEDGSEFYSRETVMKIIEFLKKSIQTPLSEEEEKKLMSQIPVDIKLRMVELFKIFKNSPVSSESESAAE